ncbi:transglycosylase domain-containing protein [Streptomyces sp. TS71-3]|uniref:transglycosylase domain-containing protein n=1 Tax=Streptomyces sp. TS71-3 TaxID=2733862 RepID=UPI001B078D91|nr:transglycosylase domain-containing protein [Streptomyces sp. TS71-3]GHJ41379.1 penicillin-binding protein [Streptomyces sp. TS71-3]
MDIPRLLRGARAWRRVLPASGRRRALGLPGRHRSLTRRSWRRALRALRPSYPRPGRRGWRRWVPSLRQALLACAWAVLALAAATVTAYERTGIPADLNAFATQQDNVYYWADGTEMARVGPVDRQEMPLERIPADVQWAVLSAENASFYTDHGVSPSGILRAVKAMATGGDTQGGSTITQQYAKNVYLNQRQTLSRKITEMVISIKLDGRLSKRQILAGYLNTSWFGRGAYGVQRAAKAYYGKDVSQLDAGEAAFLATVLKGAGLYDPALGAANHKRAVDRWNWVLDRMVETGRLTAAERATYTTFPEPLPPPRPKGLSGQTGYLVDTARTYTAAHSGLSDAQLDLGGYQIYTTFEKPRVDALAAAVREQRKSLRPESREADGNVRTGAASVAADGRILALYGGPDYVTQGFDDANISIVPAGTLYGPFVYAAGLRDGLLLERGAPRTPLTPARTYDGDNKAPVRTPEGPYWDRNGKIVKTVNGGNRSYGRISISRAVAQSVNAPVVQLGMDVGLNRVRQASIDAGLLPGSFGEQVPAFFLGTATPSPIRMASAYGTFLASGTHTEPYSVVRITHHGSAAPVHRPAPTHPFSPAVAHEVEAAVHGGSGEGTGAQGTAGAGTPGGATTGAERAGRAPSMARTGTSTDGRAGWCIGDDGKAVTAVAAFRIDPRTQQLQSLEGLAGHSGMTAARTFPSAVLAGYTQEMTN